METTEVCKAPFLCGNLIKPGVSFQLLSLESLQANEERK